MSSMISFLESVGRDAALRHASSGQLDEVMRRGRIAPVLRAAILGGERAEIDSWLGVRSRIYCATFPVKTPAKAPPKPGKAPTKPGKKPSKAPSKGKTKSSVKKKK